MKPVALDPASSHFTPLRGLVDNPLDTPLPAALYGKITSPAVTNALNKELKSIGASLDSIGKNSLDTTGKTLDDAKKKVKSLLSD